MRPGTQPAWDDAPWVNWTGDLSVVPKRHYYPSSLDELCQLVQEAERQDPPCEVHAAGSRWSFCGPSASAGFVVETRALDRSLETEITRSLRPDPAFGWQRWGADQLGACHVEAGVVLHELCLRLDGRRHAPPPTSVGPPGATPVSRWALPTMGGSSGQTLAGAVSTSTHGMDVDLPPLADAVRALHLVGPGGRQHWIERSAGVTYDDALRRVYPGIEIHRDDELLAAAAVSLGRFGIIYSVLLDVVPQFSLRTVTRRTDWSAAASELADGGVLREHRAVQVVVSPYAGRPRGTPSPARTCYVTTRDLAPKTRTRREFAGLLVSRAVNAGGNMLRLARAVLLITWLAAAVAVLARTSPTGALIWTVLTAQLVFTLVLPFALGRPGDLVAAACAWADRRGRWPVTAWVVRTILRAAQRPGSRVGVGFQIMAGPPWADDYYRGHSVEVFFDGTDPSYLDTITDHLLPVIEANARQGRAIAGWFSLRFTGRGSPMLAMQRWDRTVSVEVAVLRGIPGSVEVLREIEAAAVAHGGLVHWGQQNDLAADAVHDAFPTLPQWQARLLSLCRTSTETRTFGNDYCRTRGLAP